ncbi:hypothetical protein KFE25_013523 [Diacronema lutheri]|uniref:DNA helicase n=1 Tax=Diacronema lutheri TaxID=2081491 RepID=A0A8J6CFW5_DIALT|nr:hypothetical protein KFE25_013523 [Diacronema lutheri]
MVLEVVHEGEYLSASVQELFKGFLRKHCAGEIEALLLDVAVERHFQVEIDMLDLYAYSPLLGNLLAIQPERTLQFFDDAINDYQSEMMEALEQVGDTIIYSMAQKPFAHARVHSVPRTALLQKGTISCIRTEDVGQLLCITGTVTRAAAVRMLHFERKVACAKCGAIHRVRAELERRNEMVMPTECGSEAGARACTSAKFVDVEGTEVCRDYQELRVQEQVQKLDVGSIPRSITVVLDNDLVDSAKPGDDVIVTGVMLRRWRPVRADARLDVELVMRANHVTVCNQLIGAGLVTEHACAQFDAFWRRHGRGYGRFRARDLLLRAVCPELRGLFILKLALMLTLLGGVTRVDPTGQRVRGESHLLLIGDPGTGKSQALAFAAALSARSVMTTGIGSTSAGLTVTATKDATGEWSLDAGALVLADGGVCCIDEFETMKEADRTTIHEAMEQQTLSVAKAGLVCKLRTRTTIFAATNPKCKRPEAAFDLGANCGIASPLLSRFDIILLMRDECEPGFDATIADFILSRDTPASVAAAAPGAGAHPAATTVGGPSQPDEPELPECTPIALSDGRDGRAVTEGGDVWDEKALRAYLECARRRIEPVMSAQAERVLSAYFERQRQAEYRHVARTTIRLLESLIRLSQAHARLMWRETVVVSDAVYAIAMIEAGASAGADGPLSSAHMPINVMRSEISHADCSAMEASATVERVCRWLGIDASEGDEAEGQGGLDADAGEPSDLGRMAGRRATPSPSPRARAALGDDFF